MQACEVAPPRWDATRSLRDKPPLVEPAPTLSTGPDSPARFSPSHLHLSSMTPLPLAPLLAPLALPLLAPLTPPLLTPDLAPITPAVLRPLMPQLPDAVWPLDPRPRIVHAYDPPAKPWLPGHRGIDLAGTPGQPVLAATNGTITYAGPVAGRSVVVITHGPQRTTYEPVIPSVPTGTAVRAAQPIGHLSAAASHCTPTTCLHWGLLEGKTYLNPVSLLPAQPVRLLPTTPPAPQEPAKPPQPPDRADSPTAQPQAPTPQAERHPQPTTNRDRHPQRPGNPRRHDPDQKPLTSCDQLPGTRACQASSSFDRRSTPAGSLPLARSVSVVCSSTSRRLARAAIQTRCSTTARSL